MNILTSINKSELEDYTFPGTDAAILRIEEKLPQNDLEESFGELDLPHRFYPTAKGWDIKFSYYILEDFLASDGSEYSIDDFIREPKGWDHEHCSFCNVHIPIGEHSYTVENEEGGYTIICDSCALQCK